jgi:hypothetical protein
MKLSSLVLTIHPFILGIRDGYFSKQSIDRLHTLIGTDDGRDVLVDINLLKIALNKAKRSLMEIPIRLQLTETCGKKLMNLYGKSLTISDLRLVTH